MSLIKNMKIRVYFEDTDSGGVVYHSNYLKYAERARTEFLRSLAISHNILSNKFHLALVVKDLEINYINFSRLDDELDINSSIDKLTRVYVVFIQSICKKDIIIAKLRCKICIVSLDGKVRRIPNSVFTKFLKYFNSDG